MTAPFNLDDLDDAALDHLPFGVVRLGPTGRVERFNQAEAKRTGIQQWRALGRDYFGDVAATDGPLADTVASLAPGSCARIEHTFKGFHRANHAVVDLSRASDGRVYLCIQPA